MADNIVGSLFGISPEQLMQQRQARDVEQQMLVGRSAALPGSMMSPSLAPLYQQATQQGQLIGRGVGALLGAEDPELQKVTQIKQLSSQFDLTSATGMREFARSLQSIAPNEAMMAAKRADEMEASVGKAKLTEAQTIKALREKDASESDLAKKLRERQEIIDQYGPNDPRVAVYDKVIARSGEGQKISVGVNAIDKEGNLRSSFLTEAKPYRDPFIAAGKIENLLTSESSLGDKISKKQWGKLAGDATISNKDTEGLTQFGDLGTRLNGILTQFAEGKYSDTQRQEAINLARQIKAQSESGYNEIRGQYQIRGKAENLNPDTMSYIAPTLPKTSRSFVVGKVYADKNGKQGIFEGYNTDGTPKFKPANK